MSPTVAPYGTWKSPITSAAIVAGTIGLGAPLAEGDCLYWSESRPSEGGRITLVRRDPKGATQELLPAPWNVRTRVHEYGGGAWTVAAGQLYFSHFNNGRLYVLPAPGGEPQALTPEVAWRYADLHLDAGRDRLLCVCEDHSGPTVENRLVAIPLDGSAREDASRIVTLASGQDFFASLALSPDGRSLVWLAWNQPQMPWDGTTLWQAALNPDGSLQAARAIAGGPEESIFQPTWSPNGQLYFVSDRSGWWNLYRQEDVGARPLCPLEAEFGLPQWVFGMATYAFASADEIICTYTRQGLWRLARLHLPSGHLQDFDLPYTSIANPTLAGQAILFLAGSPTEDTAIVRLEPQSGEIEILQRSSQLQFDRGYLSQPQAIEFPTSDGQTAHGLLYLPQNQDYQAPAGEKPPLKIKLHGGPTAQTGSSLNPNLQYWTSRGFAVLDVNYRGSTGFGRAYHRSLDGQWGVADVADCAWGAKYLVEAGWVDGDRLTIAGGSAGGYTTLAALAFTEVFRAGASYYGVSDLESLARDTHKFEARYLDCLIGPYPEQAELYRERSPLHHVDRLNRPVIFFQGLDDRVVPPNQTEMMVEALKAKGIPVAYVPFAGEQHGFRQADNIRRALDSEFHFYARIFGFEPADPLDAPLEIFNLLAAT